MQHMHVIYTKRLLNPFSWIIRWGIPISRFAIARSSHSMVVDGSNVIEAHMVYGVREVPLAVALKGATIVAERFYPVKDTEAGLAFMRGQIDTYVPVLPRWLQRIPVLRTVVEVGMRMRHNNYDFKGAFGLALAPDRNWQDPSNWQCYEITAGGLKHAGFEGLSEDATFLTETVLLGLKSVPMEPILRRVA